VGAASARVRELRIGVLNKSSARRDVACGAIAAPSLKAARSRHGALFCRTTVLFFTAASAIAISFFD